MSQDKSQDIAKTIKNTMRLGFSELKKTIQGGTPSSSKKSKDDDTQENVSIRGSQISFKEEKREQKKIEQRSPGKIE